MSDERNPTTDAARWSERDASDDLTFRMVGALLVPSKWCAISRPVFLWTCMWMVFAGFVLGWIARRPWCRMAPVPSAKSAPERCFAAE